MSLFVILGIMILVVIALSFFFRSQIADQMSQMEIAKTEKAKQAEIDLASYASSCLKKTSVEGIQVVLANGGFYKNEGNTVAYHTFSVPYYLYGKTEALPSIGGIAASLARYIDDNIEPCLSAYSSNLNVGNIKTEVSMSNKAVIEARQALAFESGDISVKVSSFDAEVDFNINDLYRPTLDFYDEVKDLSYVDFLGQGYSALGSRYKFFVDETGERESVFILLYPAALEGKNVEWMFAIKYPQIGMEPATPAEMFS